METLTAPPTTTSPVSPGTHLSALPGYAPPSQKSVTIAATSLSSLPTPPRRLIVGLSGRLRSGKDTAAQVLIGSGFSRESFAAALKEFMYAVNPLVPVSTNLHGHPIPTEHVRLAVLVDEIGWERAKDTHPEVRALLQRCGTEAGRGVLGEQVWVNAAMNRLPAGDVVFTDVRFPNEAAAIRNVGGVVIRVERPGLPNTDAHPSETAMAQYPFDATVVNDSTVADLHTRLLFAVLTSARR